MKYSQLNILQNSKPQFSIKPKRGFTIRNCDNCAEEYHADNRNLKRGWGKCCSKSCAAQLREKSKPDYSSTRVLRNNIKRENWNKNEYGEKFQGYTSEGYKIYEGVAYDEFGMPVYNVGIGEYDEGDSEYWNDKDYN